ncbi:hypothetical protein [Labrys sp. ZIDIC5]|uniref:hypothetical protein n=1 Tax=Labrys sedimenti TaxID=3106036 RepID=UPI002ACAA09B|nr:hypothetical protein [Labrys sp. ZIDIC5]MDZ5450208.1 hypothetical protein [Labrys sp. ZIDIC5]
MTIVGVPVSKTGIFGSELLLLRPHAVHLSVHVFARPLSLPGLTRQSSLDLNVAPAASE